MTQHPELPALPDYVSIDDPNCPNREVLRTPARTLIFPLNDEDRQMLTILKAKYDQEENMSGLAAPQIGFSIRAIIFAVSDDPEMKKWRPDISDTMPVTMWLNPTYEPVGEDKHSDYEGCFSVKELAGNVDRYKTVKYTAYTPNGEYVEGVARGFLARVIQHEVDHTNGILFIDRANPTDLFNIEEYRAKRRQAILEGREIED